MACHEDNPYGKFFGACNDAKGALDRCFAVRIPRAIFYPFRFVRVLKADNPK